MLQRHFQPDEAVHVAAEGGWPQAPTGRIVTGPYFVETLQGTDFYYWIAFDTPQPAGDGDGPYVQAQILSRYLERL